MSSFLPKCILKQFWKLLNRYKSNIIFLKGESGGEGKIFPRVFLNRYEDRLCKGVLNIPLLQCLSSLF